MAPIPSATLPGLKLLYDRALMALERCQEAQSIDFKRAGDWESLRWRITETVLGMGNLRDGGLIILGVSETGSAWKLTGVSEQDLSTFDVDTVIDQINSYISPHVGLTLATLPYDNAVFLAIEVQEFSDMPLVCKRNPPQNANSKLVEGGVYVRPPGMAKTTRVMDAQQMHDLLNLAAEKRARTILEVGRRIGLVPDESARQKFDSELGEL